MAGNGAAHEQQAAVGVDAHDLQVRDRPAHRAEVARHALAGKHLRRGLILAGRAGPVVRDRVAVARAVRGEVVALDDAGETLPDRGAGDVDFLAHLEDVDPDFAADLEVLEIACGDAELPQDGATLDSSLGEVAGHRLGDARGAALPEGHLHGRVAVGVGLLDLRDAVVGDLEHRHRQAVAIVGEDAGHADLAADESETHDFFLLLVTPELPPGGQLQLADGLTGVPQHALTA